MAYRDELEAMRARVDRLEEELDAAHEEIARLSDRGAEAPPRTPRSWFLGGPTRVTREVELDGELSEDGYERIVSALREELGSLGSVDRVGRSLAWRAMGQAQHARMLEATVEVRDGRTRIRLIESFGALAGSLFGGIGGGVGGGALGGIIPLAIFAGVPEVVMPAIGVAWIGAVLGGVRLLYGRTTRARERSLHALADRLERIAREVVTAPVVQVRVEDAEDGEGSRDEEPADEDIEAPTRRRGRRRRFPR